MGAWALFVGTFLQCRQELGRCQRAVPRGWEMGDTLCCLSRPFLLLIPNPCLTELSVCFLLKRWVVTPILQRGAKKAQKSYFLMPQVTQLWITGSQMCVMSGRLIEKDGKKKKNTNNALRNNNSQHLLTARYCPVTDEETMVQRGEVPD